MIASLVVRAPEMSFTCMRRSMAPYIPIHAGCNATSSHTMWTDNQRTTSQPSTLSHTSQQGERNTLALTCCKVQHGGVGRRCHENIERHHWQPQQHRHDSTGNEADIGTVRLSSNAVPNPGGRDTNTAVVSACIWHGQDQCNKAAAAAAHHGQW